MPGGVGRRELQVVALGQAAAAGDVDVDAQAAVAVVLDGADDVRVGRQVRLLPRRHRTADRRHRRLERHAPRQRSAAPAELVSALDDDVGAEATDVEVGGRRDRAHRVEAARREDVQRVGVREHPDRRREHGELRELGDREHREVRQRLVVGDVELPADVGLADDRAPVTALVASWPAAGTARPAGRRVRSASRGPPGRRSTAPRRRGTSRSPRRRPPARPAAGLGGEACRALHEDGQAPRGGGRADRQVTDSPQPVGVHPALVDVDGFDPVTAHRFHRSSAELADRPSDMSYGTRLRLASRGGNPCAAIGRLAAAWRSDHRPGDRSAPPCGLWSAREHAPATAAGGTVAGRRAGAVGRGGGARAVGAGRAGDRRRRRRAGGGGAAARRGASRSGPASTGSASCGGRARSSRARVCRARRRWSPRRASAGCRCSASWSSAGGSSSGRSSRSRGPTARRRPPSCSGRSGVRRAARSRSPATSAPPSRRWPALAGDATVVCEASSFQLEDTLAFAPEVARAAEPDARPPRPPRQRSRTTATRSCGSSPTRGPATSPCCPATLTGLHAGRARRLSRSAAPGSDLALERRGADVGGRAAARRRARSRCAARTTSQNAMAAAAAALAFGVERGRGRRGAARRSRASSTGSRRSRTIGGVTWVNDSKATNVASTLVALAAFDAPGAPDPRRRRRRARSFDALREPLAHGASPPPTSSARRRASCAPRSRARCRLHDCGDLERAVARAHARAASRARSCCSRRPARASTSIPGGFEERGAHFKALVAALGV